MAEFTVKGVDYRSGKMPARTQVHVLRRMAPIMGPLQALSAGIAPQGAFVAMAEAIAALSDEAADYILDHCLAVVERKQGEAVWSKIKPNAGPGLQFADIDMMAMLQIASNVLRDNYEALFREGLASLSGEAKPST